MSDETKPAPSEPPESGPPEEAPLRAESAPPKMGHPAYGFLAAVSILSLAADLATKWWAKTNLEMPLDDPRLALPKRLELIKGYVALVFARNKGGAWGLLQDENESIRRPFFLLISAAAIVFIVSLYRKLNPGQTALKWGLPLVLGGALGNLVDRIRYGHVVDFIDVFMVRGGKEHHWPTFNVADIAICVGVGLMAVDMFTSRKKPAPAKLPASDDPGPRSVDPDEGPSSAPPSSSKRSVETTQAPAEPTPAPPADGA
jgi:signal peptidase II